MSGALPSGGGAPVAAAIVDDFGPEIGDLDSISGLSFCLLLFSAFFDFLCHSSPFCFGCWWVVMEEVAVYS